MSKQKQPSLVVNWAPGSCTSYSPRTGTVQHGATFAEAVHGCDTSAVLAALSPKVCFLRTAYLPDAPRAELDLIVRNMAGKDLPLPIDQAAVDYWLSDHKGPQGRLAAIYATASDNLARVRSEAAEAGIASLTIQPAALGVQLLAKADKIDTGLFVTEEPEFTHFDVIEFGLVSYSRSAKSPADIDVEKLRTLASAQKSDQADQFTLYSSSANSFGAAVLGRSALAALALQDLKRPPLKFELWSEKEAHVKKARSLRLRNASMVLAASIALALYVTFDYSSAKTKAAAAAAHAKQEAASLKDYASKIQTRADGLQPAFTVLSRGFDPAQPFSDVLTSLADDIPSGIWMTGLSLQKGKDMTLRGTAMNAGLVNTCVDNLTKDSRFRNVKLIFTTNAANGQQTLVQFSISAFPVGNLPLQDKPANGGTI